MKTKSLLPLLAASALLLPATRLIAQDAAPQTTGQSADQMTGVSHPEKLDDTIVSTDDPATQKPSPAVPMPQPAPAQAASSDHYVPPSTDATYNNSADAGYDNTAAQPTQTPTLHPRGYPASAQNGAFDPNNPDSGVVTTVALGPNDLPVGTHMVAQLNNTISTKLTAAGTLFAAELTQPVMRNGRVLLPAGTIINGRVSQIHGGRRITGASAIRLTPNQIILPNGSTYPLNAEVVELDHFNNSRVNDEGVITSNHDNRVAAGATALTTTSGLVAGALIGGPVGAGVGAGIGAGVGVYWWLRQEHQQTLPTGTEIVFSLDDILSVPPVTANAIPTTYTVPPPVATSY